MASPTTSAAAFAASNGPTSSNFAPHRKNAAQRNRSDSPYQQRTTQKDNPTQVLIKQAVDYLMQQLEAGLIDTGLRTRGGLAIAAAQAAARGTVAHAEPVTVG